MEHPSTSWVSRLRGRNRLTRDLAMGESSSHTARRRQDPAPGGWNFSVGAAGARDRRATSLPRQGQGMTRRKVFAKTPWKSLPIPCKWGTRGLVAVWENLLPKYCCCTLEGAISSHCCLPKKDEKRNCHMPISLWSITALRYLGLIHRNLLNSNDS